ncbi:MAG TPA: ATP-binding protein, partial [Actinomycetota bacterium]|nr:ATP-binding protein [Actinomycetota bacterium]
APVETVPTLDQLDELIRSFQESGLEVEWRSSGEHRPLSPAVEMTGYRVVQESLTNAHKHGSATGAKLRLDYSDEGLSIEVLNRGDSGGPDQPGNGIVGMRERVEAVGGTIEVGRAPDGRFRVHATLPVASQ